MTKPLAGIEPASGFSGANRERVLFHDPGKIVIAHFGGDEDHLPSLWSDGYWRIGREDVALVFDDDDP